MRKKHRIIAIIIVALVSLSMIGSTFVLFFTNSSSGASASGSGNNANSQVQGLQSQIDSLNQGLKSNPQDTNLRLSLANAYYDMGMLQLDSSQEQAAASLKQAVAAYQEVAKTNKDDVNVLVDLATAAFYSGDNTLAETTFKQALTLKPDFFNALLNYGYFLMNAKGDYIGAIAEFNKALNTNPSPTDADRVKSLISMAQARLSGGQDSKQPISSQGNK
ncbi:tetratricopeptide repeat protein [Desulfitobacterium sp. AusDCA]|uniref:tetratricopeptide repeat protein n=1 Tax=Desulfitobacterium sp. AusDCA TaxID=3240383 RepID=UPI003DA6EFD3